jgi:predicted ATPase
MVALYRCGRQADALEAFTSTRIRLRDELGLEPGTVLRELQRRILEHDPTLAADSVADEPSTDLPSPPNRLLGRERELGELGGLLHRDDVRLVVLTGAGGSGKTRLALEVARQNAGLFANGVALAELGPLRDPGLVPGIIAGAVDIREQAGDPVAALTAALRPREMLLVIDNAEHLREAAALYVDLLAAAPRLKLLITSRAVLHLSGERVYPVEPLAQDAAMALFRERAQAAEPRFEAGESESPVIHGICERLDRLPLAIELAATRIRMLSPAELLEALDARLPLLTGGPQDLPARQQTLRATIDWSYELLDQRSRRDLVGLAVFAGGFTLEAAQAVVGAGPNSIATLLDHNLIQRMTNADRSRYTMLETIRENALERVGDRRRNSLMRRLAEFLVAQAQAIAPQDWTGRGSPAEVLAVEFHNMRVALAWALERHEAALALGLATEFRWFRFAQAGAHVERSRWLDEALRASGDVPPEIRARALDSAARIALILGDFDKSARLAEQCIRAYRELRNDRAEFEALHVLGAATSRTGDLERGRSRHEEALALARRISDRVRVHRALHALAEIELELGNLDEASQQLEQCVAFAREAGEPAHLSSVLCGLADAALMRGELARAASLHRESIQVVQRARLWPAPGVVYSVGGLAAVAALAGQAERSARLWKGVEALEREWGTPLNDPERKRYAAIVSTALGGSGTGGRSTQTRHLQRRLMMSSARR